MTSISWIRGFGYASLKHELHIIWKRRDRAVERLAIRRKLRRIAAGLFRGHLQRARIDVALDVVHGLRGFRGEGLRGRDRLSRLLRFVQLDVRVTQANMGEGHLRIEPQRLVKRSRRLDPDVVVKVGEALIVKTLCLRVLRPRIVMDDADAGANRDRSFEKLLGN